jgi:hypothetical protein
MAKDEAASGARFCIVPQSALAVFRQRSTDEAVRAQSRVDPALFEALEDMLKAARAGRLESQAITELQAIAW